MWKWGVSVVLSWIMGLTGSGEGKGRRRCAASAMGSLPRARSFVCCFLVLLLIWENLTQ